MEKVDTGQNKNQYISGGLQFTTLVASARVIESYDAWTCHFWQSIHVKQVLDTGTALTWVHNHVKYAPSNKKQKQKTNFFNLGMARTQQSKTKRIDSPGKHTIVDNHLQKHLVSPILSPSFSPSVSLSLALTASL